MRCATQCTLPSSQHNPMNTTPPWPPHLHKGHPPPHKASHTTREISGDCTPEVWNLSWPRRHLIHHPTPLQYGGPSPPPATVHSLPHLGHPSTRMENGKLCGHSQTWQENILQPQALPPHLSPMMLWKTPRIYHRQAALPGRPHLWCHTPLTDRGPGRKLSNQRPTQNNHPYR